MMSEQNKLFEIYCAYSKDKKNNLFENPEYYMDLLGEAVMNSIYKGTVFLADDDKKFLAQFDPSLWKDALYQRYNIYLWEYLKKLQEAREEKFQQYFQQHFKEEYQKIKNDDFYKNFSEQDALKLAKENARQIAKTIVDHEINDFAEEGGLSYQDNADSVFDIPRRGRAGIRVFANPYIKELVKKLEGTKGNHDGFDLHNPRILKMSGKRDKSGRLKSEGEVVEKKYTDGFAFPTKAQIDDMIEKYMKALGHGFIKYEDSDKKYKDEDPSVPESERQEYDAFWRNPNIKDNLSRDILKHHLYKRAKQKIESDWRRANGADVPYKHMTNQEEGNRAVESDAKTLADEWMQDVWQNRKLKSPKHPVTGDRKQIEHGDDFHDLHLLYRKGKMRYQNISKKKTGWEAEDDISTKEIELPVIPGGHHVRMLDAEELDLIDKVEAAKKLNPDARLEEILTLPEYQKYERLFRNNHNELLRGNHFDWSRKDHPEEEGGRYRPIHIKSDHELELAGKKSAQGTSHVVYGGFNPTRETSGRNFLGKYTIETKYDENGNPIHKTVENPQYKKVIKALFVDKVFGDLKEFIKSHLTRILSSSKQQGTFNLSLERRVLLLLIDELTEVGYMNVLNNLGEHNIEKDPKKIKDMINKMIANIEQQNIGRGSRRTRAGFGILASQLGSFDNMDQFMNSVTCSVPSVAKRKISTGKCTFPYNIDKVLRDETKINSIVMDITSQLNLSSASTDVSDVEKAAKDSDEVQDKEFYVTNYITAFKNGLQSLSTLYYLKIYNDAKDSKNGGDLSDEEETKIKEQAFKMAEDFVFKTMSSSSSVTQAGEEISKEMSRAYGTIPHPEEVEEQPESQENMALEVPVIKKPAPVPDNVEAAMDSIHKDLDEKPWDYMKVLGLYRGKISGLVLDQFKREIENKILHNRNFMKSVMLFPSLEMKYLQKEELENLRKFIEENASHKWFTKKPQLRADIEKKIEEELAKR